MPADYSKYELISNPFNAILDPNRASSDRFVDRIRGRELQRALGVFDEVVKDASLLKMWIIKDELISIENNIAVIARMFPMLEEKGHYAIYLALPLIYQDPLKGFYTMLADKLQAVRLRIIVYELIKQGLASAPSDETLVEGITAGFLRKQIEDKGDTFLDSIFFPAEKAIDEKEAEDDADELQAVDTEEMIDPMLKNALIGKTEQWLVEREISGDVLLAVKKALDDDFEAGFSMLSKTGNYRENIDPILKLLRVKYEKIIVVLDQLEGWEALDDKEQGKLLGAISEFSWISGSDAVMMLVCANETKDRLEKHVGPGAVVELDLEPASWFGNRLSEDQVRQLIKGFLTSDDKRRRNGNDSLDPFTDDAVKWIADREWSDIYDVTELLKNSLDYAAVKDVESIDVKVLTS